MRTTVQHSILYVSILGVEGVKLITTGYIARTMEMSAYQSIPEYYAGKSLFITGGTGFLGKALVEKLLRSCPDIKKIYLLVRPKGDVGSKERVEKILDSEVGFQRRPIQHYSCQMNFKNVHVQKSTNYLSMLIHKLHGGMFATYIWSRL